MMTKPLWAILGSTALAATLLLGGATATAAVANSQKSGLVQTDKSHDNQKKQKHSLVGSWQIHVTFETNPPPTIPTGEEAGVQSFNADGVTSNFASGTRATGFGVWEPLGKGGEFRFTFHELVITLEGEYVGYVIVNQTGKLSSDGQTFTSSGSGQFYTPEGVPAGPASQTVTTGARIGF